MEFPLPSLGTIEAVWECIKRNIEPWIRTLRDPQLVRSEIDLTASPSTISAIQFAIFPISLSIAIQLPICILTGDKTPGFSGYVAAKIVAYSGFVALYAFAQRLFAKIFRGQGAFKCLLYCNTVCRRVLANRCIGELRGSLSIRRPLVAFEVAGKRSSTTDFLRELTATEVRAFNSHSCYISYSMCICSANLCPCGNYAQRWPFARFSDLCWHHRDWNAFDAFVLPTVYKDLWLFALINIGAAIMLALLPS
jgi:hypothetical protein